MRDEWKLLAGTDQNPLGFQLEIRSFSSYSEEFLRSIVDDLYLIPVAALIVTGFTIVFAFGKCDKVHSRGLLGAGAVVAIVASIMTSFGILFAVGIPFTTQTVMVPFLMFGACLLYESG